MTKHNSGLRRGRVPLAAGLLIFGLMLVACAPVAANPFATPGDGSTPAAEAPPPGEDVSAERQTASVRLTYYTCEDGFCGKTASGTTVHAGTAACDPGWMGRSFVIEGDPAPLTYTCEDTGGSVSGNHVDIWFATHAEGRRLIDALGTSATIEFR